jgi:hypothetical protein
MTNLCQKAETTAVGGDAKRGNLNRQEGLEYLPMNVFVDPVAMKMRFQYPANDAPWMGVGPVG